MSDDLQRQVDYLAESLRDIQSWRRDAERQALLARIGAGETPSRVGLGGVPSIRAGASASFDTLGNTQPFLGQANVLLDPTFETLVPDLTVGTSPATRGAWSAHHVLSAGTAPTVRYIGTYLPRGYPNGNPFNSALALLSIGWTAAYTGDFYIYAATGFVPQLVALPYLVAALRVATQDHIDVATSATATMQIYDGTTVYASDPLDLVVLGTETVAPLFVATQQSAGDFQATTWKWRLKISLNLPATSATSFVILLAEPQLHMAYTADALPYAPALANWLPNHQPVSSGLGLVAADEIVVGRGALIMPIVSGAGANVTLTSTPTIAAGDLIGQELVLFNQDPNYSITLQDNGTLSGSTLRLTATTITLGPRDSVRLAYLTTGAITGWFQIGPVVNVL